MKKFFACFFISLFASILFCAPKKAEEKPNYLIYTSKSPSFTISVNNQDFKFLIDTGSISSYINYDCIAKLGYSKEYEKLIKTDSDEEIDAKLSDGLKDLMKELQITIDDIKHRRRNPGFKCSVEKMYIGNVEFHNIELNYDPRMNYNLLKREGYDGLIGMDVLSQLHSIAIDYSKKKIYLNEKVLSENLVPMKTLMNNSESVTDEIKELSENLNISVQSKIIPDVYTVTGKIEGYDHNCLIYTGFKGDVDLLIYPLTRNEKSEYEAQDSLNESSQMIFTKNMKIGEKTFEKVPGVYVITSSSDFFDLKASRLLTANSLSVIGDKFFKNHIIQMDFENKLFGIQ